MPIVEISYVNLLHEIAQKLEMVVPQIGMTTNADGQFVSYVDPQIPSDGSVAEVVRCWGGASSTAGRAEQDATHIAIQRLKEDLDLHIKDANYDDRFYYKNMYDHVTDQYAALLAKHGRTKWELTMLKECHSSFAAQREQLLDERLKIRAGIEECHSLINRLGVGMTGTGGDPTDSNSSAVAPPS